MQMAFQRTCWCLSSTSFAPLRLSLAHKVERITLSEVLECLSQPESRPGGGSRKCPSRAFTFLDAIVGFADLRGFTMLSQTLPGEVLVNTMNQFFAAIEKWCVEAAERS